MKYCTRCIYNENTAGISFDENGVCNYCKMMDDLMNRYGTGCEKGRNLLNEIVQEMKNVGKNKKYDCIVGVSGGTDSSYMLHWAIEQGLRPLAVHYDNTWNTAIATENIHKVTKKLNVDLYTHVLNNEESNDIVRSFFKSGINTIDIATDLALAETLYRAASKFKVKYILEGHSFVAEGVSPVGNSYVDGKLIDEIRKKYGTKKWKTYPLMTFSNFLKWTVFKRIRKIRPLWYFSYSKVAAQEMLQKEYNWQYYGGHHLENRITAFAHSVYKPQKYNIDERNNSLSAAVRNGFLDREEAIKQYNSPPIIEDGLINYFIKRVGITMEQYEEIMHKGTKRTFHDFKTYKKRFELLRPLFYTLARSNLVPMSFYMKYCFPFADEIGK